MRKRGKKLLAIMLAASMTLGQGSTWTLAQEEVAETIEGATLNAQTDETGAEKFGDEGEQDTPSGDSEESQIPGEGENGDTEGNNPSGNNPSENNPGNGDNNGENPSENGESGTGDDGSFDDEPDGEDDLNGNGNQNGTPENPDGITDGESGDDTIQGNNESRVLTAQLTVADDTNEVWGSGILTGSGEMDDINWDGGDNNTRGYDKDLDNNIIRSFDSITYNVKATFTTVGEAQHVLVYEVTLPDDDELSLNDTVMHVSNQIEVTKNKTDGTKTYKCTYSLQEDYAGGMKEENIVVKVGNKHQGDTISPQIRAYLDDAPQDQWISVNNMETVTVTTAPMYNIVLKKRASTSASRNVYDFNQTPYLANAEANGYTSGKVNGYEQTFGLALELKKPRKGIKGVELPDPNQPFTFDVDLSNAMLNETSMPDNSFIPLLYECTVNQPGGAAVWEIPFTNQGLNGNGIQSGCYNSGTYSMIQEGTTLHVTVTGFAIDKTQYPKSNLANQSYWEDINEIREGIFSAFQFKVIYPYERASDGKNLQEVIGDGTVNVKASVPESTMHAVSENGTETRTEATYEDNEQTASWELRSGGKRSQAIWYSSRNLWTDEYTPGKKWDDGDIAAAGTKDVAFTVNYTEEQTGPAYETSNAPVAIDQLVVFDSSALKNVTFHNASGSDNGYSCRVLYAYCNNGHLTNETMRNVGINDFSYFTDKQRDADGKEIACDAVLVQYRGMATKDADLNLLAQFYADIDPNVETAKVYMVAAVTTSWTAGDFANEILAAKGKTNLSDISRTEISSWAQENLNGMPSENKPYKYNHTSSILDGRSSESGYTVPGYKNGQYDVDDSHRFSVNWADGLYIVPYTTTVTTTVAQLDKDGKPISQYDLGKGQRYVDYAISTSIKYLNNVKVPDDATTTVYLEETISDGLTYVPGSAYWGGAYMSQIPAAGSVDGGIQYEPEFTKNQDGLTVLKWAIPKVALRNGELPKMHYTCKIGNELDPGNDVADNQTLKNSTTIQTDEDKRPILEKYNNISDASITVTRAKEFYIVKRGGAHLELEDSSYYEMIASNTSSNDVRNLCIFDTMPYSSGDSEKTKPQKKGEYKITSLKLNAEALKNSTADDIQIWYTNNPVYAGKTAKDLSESMITAANGWKQANAGATEDGYISFSGDGLIDAWPTVIAYKDANLERNTVASLRLEYSAVAGAENDDFDNTWSMSSADGEGHQKEIASTVETDVYKRTLEGTVWYDGIEDENDGKMSQNETKLAGVKVTLLRKNDNTGEYEPYTAYKETITVTNEDGTTSKETYQCPSVLYTDPNGHYKFTGLPQGEYRVKFESSDGFSLGEYDITKDNEGTKEESSKVEKDNTTKENDQLTSGSIVGIKMPTIEEMISEGKKTYNLPDQNLGLITPQVTVKVNKQWYDNDNQDGKRPESITVRLLADGKETNQTRTLQADKNGKWNAEFKNLDKFKMDGQKLVKINYSIKEISVEGYTSNITSTSKDNVYSYTVENTHTPETISVSGTKIWNDNDNRDGKRPGSITVNLLADNEKIQSSQITAQNNWSWNFTDLPKYKNGAEISYTITEDSVKDYLSTVNGYNLTNSYKISIPVSKIWDDNNDQDGKRPDSIIVNLLADKKVIKSETVNELDNWSCVFENLPKYNKDENGNDKEIEYTITENEVSGYTTTIKKNDDNDISKGYEIKNSHTPETVSVSGSKKWNDKKNQDRKRPDKIIIRLWNGGENEVAHKEITADDGWKWTFADLPKYANGHEISYNITEDAVEGYTTTLDGNTIINSYTPEEISILVAKNWLDNNNQDGKRPDEITVYLYANGNKTEKELTITKDNNWMGSFTGLAKYQDGKKIEYTIGEKVVDGYDSKITGNTQTGFQIRNTHIPELISIEGKKTWDDNENQDGKRPEKITIHLWKEINETTEETETVKMVEEGRKEVSADDNWSWKFENLPKYENGTEIKYTVTEDEIKGYKSTVDGYNVTNTHTPEKINIPVEKIWKDANNADNIRPEKVVVHLYANDVDTKKVLELSKDNEWKGTFTELDKYEKGEFIKYTVKEDTVNGYSCEITGDMENGYTVTNTHTPTPPYIPDPKPTATPTPSVTPSVTPSTTPAPSGTPTPSETPKPSEAPKPSVTPPSEATPTPAPAAGSITVTKTLKVNGTPVGAENQKFYVALFEDEDCTQRASDVKTLTFQYASSATVTFDNLESGKTYYVSETDENGEAILAGILDSGDIYTADFTNGNVVSVDGKNGSAVDFDNEFEDIPDGFYYVGNLKVTKTLLGADGKAKNSDKTFYAGVFADADHTKLSDQVARNIIPLSLNGASSVSDTVEVYMENADSVVKLYVTEVDKNGTPVDKDSSFAYSVTVKDGNATISKDALDASVVITNQEKNNPIPQGGDTPSTQGGGSTPQSYSDGSSSVTPVKTGDSTPIMAMLLLLAASALVISTVMVKKKKK